MHITLEEARQLLESTRFIDLVLIDYTSDLAGIISIQSQQSSTPASDDAAIEEPFSPRYFSSGIVALALEEWRYRQISPDQNALLFLEQLGISGFNGHGLKLLIQTVAGVVSSFDDSPVKVLYEKTGSNFAANFRIV